MGNIKMTFQDGLTLLLLSAISYAHERHTIVIQSQIFNVSNKEFALCLFAYVVT